MMNTAIIYHLIATFVMGSPPPYDSQGNMADPSTQRGQASLNTMLYWITQTCPFDMLVQDAADLTLNAENVVALVLGIATTQDTVTDSQCTNITVIYARGTSEAGSVGVIVGPGFFSAVEARLETGATLSVKGVEYTASIPGFLQGGDPAGSKQMRAFPFSSPRMFTSNNLEGRVRAGQRMSLAPSPLAPIHILSWRAIRRADKSRTMRPGCSRRRWWSESAQPCFSEIRITRPWLSGFPLRSNLSCVTTPTTSAPGVI